MASHRQIVSCPLPSQPPRARKFPSSLMEFSSVSLSNRNDPLVTSNEQVLRPHGDLRSANSVMFTRLLSAPDVPGCANREDTFIPPREQHPLQHPAPLIMEKVLVPFVLH